VQQRAPARHLAHVGGWICLDYHVKLASGGTEMTLKKKGIYTGDLVKRPDGWQITDIREGCGGS
jgi:hypothetical protein